RTLALIARAMRHPYKFTYWAAAIAAALLALVGLGAIAAIHFTNQRKAVDFLASGRSFLEQAYGAQKSQRAQAGPSVQPESHLARSSPRGSAWRCREGFLSSTCGKGRNA